MNKKMICGILLTLVGLVYSVICFLYTLMNPCIYNGIGGLTGAFLGADTLLPFIISAAAMCMGLLLCFIEAYRKR